MVEVRIPQFQIPLVNPRTGLIDRQWARFFNDLWQRTGGLGDVSLQSAGDDLTAIEALTSTGILVRTANNTWALREISAGGGMLVEDGDGVSGDPTLDAALRIAEITVSAAELAAAGTKAFVDALGGETYKIREAFLSGAGTNFSGGSGDRNLSITDGTSTWSIIPAATLQSLSAARWGATALPFPATASHLTTASAAGTDIVAQYQGGSNDYAAGSCTIVLTLERIT